MVAAAMATLSMPAAAEPLERVRMASGRTVSALPGQVIVRYRPGAARVGAGRMTALGAATRRSIPALNMDLVTVPPGHTVETFLARLRNDANVEFAEPNVVMHALAFPDTKPNDAKFDSQYALGYSTATFPASINVKDAWKITTGSPTVVVAVVDTGANLSNPDFDSGSFAQGATIEIDWLGDGDCTDTPSSDPNDPNYALRGVGPDQCANSTPEDDNNVNPRTGAVDPNPTYHGTRVSGLIGATANNGLGIAGIAPECRIMPVKVLNSWGSGTLFSIAEGITWAADHGASVINLSLGDENDDPTGTVEVAVAHALGLNCVIVAAAGNSGNSTNVNFPAAISGVVAVGAIDQTAALSAISATGKQLDLVAPGVDIQASVPASVEPVDLSNTKSGTSFSAPMVSAVAALIRSIRPTTSWSQVVQYIDFTATDSGASGFDTSYGFGRLNAGAAVEAARDGRTFFSNPASPGDTFPYPNPFHPGNGQTVTISLPSSLGSQGIEIDIRNIAGEKIRTISGTNVWDGSTDGGGTAASGLYFYVARTSSGEAKGKLTLIK